MVNLRRILNKDEIPLNCNYGAKRYSITIDKTKSPYAGLMPTMMSLDFLPYYSTIDDPAIIDASEQLASQLKGRDDRIKAAVVLAMVQQNIKYKYDEEIYGCLDVWGLPVTVADLGVGDCDCMSNLYVSLAHNLGLDVICVTVSRHMFPAVCFDGGHGRSYEFDGKTYFHMEATDEVPVAGRYWDIQSVEAADYPKIPTEQFKEYLAEM